MSGENEHSDGLAHEVAVTYTVKELLARIEDRQIRLDERFSSLVESNEDRFTRVATLTEMKELREIVSRHEARWNRVLGAALGVAALAGGAAGWVSNVLVAG